MKLTAQEIEECRASLEGLIADMQTFMDKPAPAWDEARRRVTLLCDMALEDWKRHQVMARIDEAEAMAAIDGGAKREGQ